ncbi:MAG TPA: hypothetical protein VN841_24160 [Bryobacteraceae bacterium]|nr:hypothetical protein [Bryobacteraceae bacterium]
MNPVTLLGAGLCFLVLFLKYWRQRANPVRSSPKQRLKTAKILLAAVVTWLGLFYTLQHMLAKMDGPDTHEPTLMERIVAFLK